MSILIDENTRALVQGITGRQASRDVRYCLEYGTRIVAGVTPGKGGETVHGVSVYDHIRKALSRHEVNTSVIYVSGRMVKEATLEAIDAGLKLVLIISENVPVHDLSEVFTLAEAKGTRIVGPSCNGITSPDKGKLGGHGGDKVRRSFLRGNVGIASRSGGMSAETAWMLKRTGIGVSTCVSMGGDPMIGTSFVDLLELFEKDEDTHLVVMFCEPGGTLEEEAAEFIAQGGISKPVVAYVGGKFMEKMPKGVSFGHAGAVIEGGKGSPKGKIEALQAAGVTVVEDYRVIAEVVRDAMQGRRKRANGG